MNSVRTTIVLDRFLAERIRKMFNGNLSLGINKLIEGHFAEKNFLKKKFGTLKFSKTAQEMADEDREAWGE